MRTCERCGKEIPEDYVNSLCDECYKKLEEKDKAGKIVKPKIEIGEVGKNGITESNYVENPEAEDKEQWATNVRLFERHGVILWKPTRQLYTYIKDYCLTKITEHPQYPKFIWRPKIVDIGCGCGVGSNIMSQEADFVWGIDKNEKSIRFAQQCFERTRNQIYYSSQVSFDHIDIFEDTRETMKFDLVVCIEIIEHINDYKTFLKTIINKFTRKDKNGNYDLINPTEFFISTPNRNNQHIQKNTPHNKYHVREWNAPEFYNVLSEFFNNIKFHNAIGVEIPYEEIKETTHTPILAKVWNPK
jgi:2-polyprenyl-3-methyl-5-hydroxy-6-metoxy-1,4-benzoquinol methylase